MREDESGDRNSRLGILGGTFDPPHIGHLILADQCRQSLNLDRILVFPAGTPPHKDPRSISPFGHRLAMAGLAFADTDVYSVEEAEGDRAGPSYTVETLQALDAARGGKARLWLLLGGDSLAEMETWKDPEMILRLCRLGVYGRPDYSTEGVREEWRARVDPVPGPQIDLSSTMIREMARTGRSLEYLVPEAVRDYIRVHALYGGGP
jgi:nicotinate-nucleotide adenylyltransferase